MMIQTVLFQSETFSKWDFFKDYCEDKEMQDFLNLGDRTLRFATLPKVGPEESASPMFPKVIYGTDIKSPNTILEQLATLIRMCEEGRTDELLPFNGKLMLWHYIIGNSYLGVVTFMYDVESGNKKVVAYELQQKVNHFWIWSFPFKYYRFSQK